MTQETSHAKARLAVDIGGTFTDVVLDPGGGALASVKVPTTPEAPEMGFMEGLRLVLRRAGLAPRDLGTIVHGTTLATNALIERKGAKTALVTTEGFRDSLEIGYEARFDQYDLMLEKPAPLVPRELRFAVRERVTAAGAVLEPLDEAAVLALAPRMRAERVEAVAIGFLHSYANPAHEERAGALLSEALPGVAVTLSSRACPEIREYERLSTACANAYIQPLMARYLRALERNLAAEGHAGPLMLVTSAGSMTDLETAVRFPVRLVESGPSGGAILAAVTAAKCDEPRVLSYDMGGTTAKICLIEDFAPKTARDFEVARSTRFAKGSGLPLRIPVIEMIEIGAGGGSIARVDALGRIAVGPESAGAAPGPACYGKGGEAPTVTDADALLGRLDPERFAEGRLTLDNGAAASAIEAGIARPIGLENLQAARGICELVDEAMANAARIHAMEHGKDLSDFAMVAFGGAGPLHAGRLAEKLGVMRLIVPADPGVGSAVGFLSAPLAYELVRSRYQRLDAFDASDIDALFESLSAECRAIVGAAAPGQELLERRSALMRYCGQGHEIEIAVPPGPVTEETAAKLRAAYEARYVELFGRSLPGNDIEVPTWSLVVSTAPATPPTNPATPAAVRVDPPDRGDLPSYWRPDLRPGAVLTGPALIVEPQTTTLVPAGFHATVDGGANLVLDREAGAQVDSTQEADPLRLQVQWNRLQSVVDEQAGALMRTAFSPIVRESGDLSAGIFDLEGEMLAQAVTGTPGHVNTMASACANFFDAFPRDSMRPGDLYLTNDPWLGSGHLNDFVLVRPCFHGGRLVGFASCTSHLVDIGGHCLGPDGSDVYDEGLYIPPLALVAEGRLDETLMALIKANSRSPQQAEGDVHALIACCAVGERRLRDMMREFGLDDLGTLSAHILETSERATRERIAALPDGITRNAMTVDGYDFEITLQAELTIAGGALALDFAGSSGRSRFGINVPLNYARAYTVFGLKCAIAPDIPNNAGALRPFAVTSPPGTIVNAVKPAPVCSRHIVGQLLPDVALGCLAGALPDRIPAEGAATLWDLPLRGGPLDGSGGFTTELVHNGGTGARPGRDGLSATAFPSGVMGSLVEITESVTPLLVRRRELRPDSGGAGRFRGGLGQVIELESGDGHPFTFFGTVDRIRYPARGRAGGSAGTAGALQLAGGATLPGKGASTVPPDGRLVVQTPGGGGWGDPRDRAPEVVARDVAQGLVSRAAARRDYGVAIDEEGAVDRLETARLRSGDTAASAALEKEPAE